jgi:hypothetical protein
MSAPYRDEDDALRENALDLRRRLQALDDERVELHRRMEQTDRELGSRRRLQLLQDVRIASPCDERWDDMTGNAAIRFCARCRQNVYDVSAMTAADAERLLANDPDRCLRLFRRADGKVLTADCATQAKEARRPTLVALGLGVASLVTIGAALTHPWASHAMGKNDLGVAKTDAKTLLHVVDGWRVTHGDADCPTVERLAEDRALRRDMHLEDPWGHDYEIACSAAGDSVRSLGPDGAPDTEDDVWAGR